MKNAFLATIPEKLVSLRKEAGLNIEDIIQQTGLSRSGIRKLEHGNASPTLRTLDVYTRACGRDICELFQPSKKRKA